MPSGADNQPDTPPAGHETETGKQRPPEGARFDWTLIDERMLHHARSVVRKVCRVSKVVAADAVTDAVIRLVARQEAPRDPQRLLNQVAVNIAFSQIRRAGIAPAQSPGLADEDSPTGSGDLENTLASRDPEPVEHLHAALVQLRVSEALDRLPAMDRSVLKAVYFDGVETSQLDREAGAARGTHKARLFRARERLRAERGLSEL